MGIFTTYFGKENSLRQKAVNLFYLIFLILIFSFIPSDFVDSAYHTNTSLDLISNEINQETTTSTLYFLHLLRNEPELFEDTKLRVMDVEDITANTTRYIDDLKLELINVDKMDDYGFFKNGRKETTSNELMVYGNKADSLFNKLKAYKETIATYLSPQEIEYINKILPLDPYELNSEGSLIEADKFYFGRTPLNVAVLNLSHFKSRVERIKAYTMQKIVKRVVYDNATILPFEHFKIMNDESFGDLYGASSVMEFFEKIENKGELTPFQYLENQKKLSEYQKARYYIESLTDTIHPIDRPIEYYAHFDTSGTKTMQITVSSDDGVDRFGMSKPGRFYYFPNTKGRYTFTFTNGQRVSTKRITVIDADPIIQSSRLSTLYIDIDNPLNIKTSEFDADDNLEAEITDGQIIKKGETFYARVFKKGMTQVKVYANMSYGRIKVAEKSFVIRELHKPIPHINGLESGGIVKKENLPQLKNLSLNTDEFLVDEDVYVADFEFMLIYNDYNSVLKPIKNIGASFNNVILQALSKASKGDVIVLSNIRTLSSRGNEVIIPSLTLTII